jgi:hypothetical protein
LATDWGVRTPDPLGNALISLTKKGVFRFAKMAFGVEVFAPGERTREKVLEPRREWWARAAARARQ